MRIVPLTRPHEARNSEDSGTAPAFVRLEAVFPYRMLLDGAVDGSTTTTTARSSDGSYIIIGRPLALPAAADRGKATGPNFVLPHDETGGFVHQFQAVQQRSLQEFIDEWQCVVGGEKSENSTHKGCELS